MDEPLFGEQKQKTKVAIWVIGLILAAACLFTIAICVVFGITRSLYQHFFFGVAILFSSLILFILFRWYQQGDLDPKFKFLIGCLIFLIIILCGVANSYVWIPEHIDPSSQCNNGGGMYIYQTKQCISVNNLGECNKVGYCMCINSWTNETGSVTCMNCSICASPPPSSVAASKDYSDFKTSTKQSEEEL
jgi:hypothetical protein